jgi:hypothetical protein
MNWKVSAPTVLRLALGILALGAFASSQDSSAPNPSPSIADLARQSRAQHEAAAGQPNKAQDLVDEMQREQEAEQAAPTGFRSYDAGDYRVFVPFPYSLEGRENSGAILLGSRLGVTNTEVVAGTPIPIPPNLKDIDLLNAVRQLAGLFGQYPSCSPIKLGDHKAFRCAWQGTPRLLGREVWGSMEVVVGSNSLIPVMCVSPDELHQCANYTNTGYLDCNNRYMSWSQVQQTNAAIQARYRDEKTTAQICEQIIYPSITLKEDIVVHPVSIGEKATGREKPAAGAVPQDKSLSAYGAQTGSLADLARQSRQAPHGKAQTSLNNSDGGVAPAGFQLFTLQYCQNPQHCSEASVVIPEKAEVVNNANGQYIFKTTLSGDPVMLYAGPADVNAPYRSLTNVDYIRMRDLANSNGWSHEKTDGISTQELTIDGHPALMTRFRYQRDPKIWWVGERALIQVQPGIFQPVQLQNGQGQTGQFLVGCTAPEPRFADAETLCTTLVNSLRLQ